MTYKRISWLPSTAKVREKEMQFLKELKQRMIIFGHFELKDVEHTIELLKEEKR